MESVVASGYLACILHHLTQVSVFISLNGMEFALISYSQCCQMANFFSCLYNLLVVWWYLAAWLADPAVCKFLHKVEFILL